MRLKVLLPMSIAHIGIWVSAAARAPGAPAKRSARARSPAAERRRGRPASDLPRAAYGKSTMSISDRESRPPCDAPASQQPEERRNRRDLAHQLGQHDPVLRVA